MKLFGPKHTAEEVAARLVEGLEDGTLTLEADVPAPTPPKEPPHSTVGSPMVAASLALGAFATAAVATVLVFATQAAIPWAFLVACFLACAGSAAVAFWLGASVGRS